MREGIGQVAVALAQGVDFCEDGGLIEGGDGVIGKACADEAVGLALFAVEVGHAVEGFFGLAI